MFCLLGIQNEQSENKNKALQKSCIFHHGYLEDQSQQVTETLEAS